VLLISRHKQLTPHVFLVILIYLSGYLSIFINKSGDKDDMLHPDKANGQQAHERTRVPVILRALLLGLLLGVVGLPDPATAETAVLRTIRMGDHGKYTRVVFEFSAPVQYQLYENIAAGIVSIRFLETTSQVPDIPMLNAPDCINTVSTVQDGSHTIAKISFAPKELTLNPFIIKGPDRVVLDVFCETEPAAPVAQTEPRDIAPAPITVAEPVKEKPVATRPLIEKPKTAGKAVQATKNREPSSKRDKSQKYLLLLLAAITGIIVILIALIIFQKRSLSENNVTGNPDAARETDDMMRAIDTKIKEKLMKYDE
jgi:hypothetical protein